MLRVIMVAIILVGLAITGLLAAPYFIPSSVYKEKIESAAESALGRDVTITGDVKLSLFPRIAASAGETHIANADGFGDENFASMTQLRAAVKLLPLLSKRVEVDEFILVDPTISLVQKADGTNNWTFTPATPETPQENDETPDSAGTAGVEAALGDVRLVNANVFYKDAKADQSHDLTGLDIIIKMPAMNGPVNVEGDGTVDGLDFEIDAEIANLSKLLEGVSTGVDANFSTDLASTELSGNIVMAETIGLDLQTQANIADLQGLISFLKLDIPSAKALGSVDLSASVRGSPEALTFQNVDFKHKSNLLNISFEGGAEVGETIRFNGDVDVNAPNLRGLAQTMEVTLPQGDVYKSFSMSGKAQGTPSKVSLTPANVQFDDINGKGEITVDLTKSIPDIRGSLTTNVINATPYAAASGATSEKPKPAASGSWEDTKLDLSPLKAVNITFALEAAGLKYQAIDIGKTTLNTSIKNGKFTADLSETSLYKGTGTAKIIADASGDKPSIQVVADLSALSAAPFLQAFANFDQVEGVGGLSVNLSGTGTSMGDIMSSLSGSGSFKFDNGLVKGFDAAELMNSATAFLKSGTMPAAIGEDQTTSFKTFSGNFNMANGVASTKDINFSAAGYKIPGRGALDLGKRQISLSIFPESDDKSVGINGFAPPLKLSGGWGNVSLSLDQAWLQEKLQQELTNQATKALEKELDNQLGSALGGILGNSSQKDQTGEEANLDENEEEKTLEEQLEDEAKKKILDLFK